MTLNTRVHKNMEAGGVIGFKGGGGGRSINGLKGTIEFTEHGAG